MNATTTPTYVSIKNLSTNALMEINADHDLMIARLKTAGVKFSKTSLKELLEGKREVVNGYSLSTDAAPPAGTMNVDANKPATEGDAPKPADPAPAKVHTPRAKATVKSADAKGKVKPIRKGTKIAEGIELLLAGTTVAALTAANVSDDVVDFVNRRVTKRGYGVKVDGDTITLVLPAGVTAVDYTSKAEKDEPETAPAAETPAATE